MIERFGYWLVRNRLKIIAVIGFITLLFSWQIVAKLRIESHLEDLLPPKHSYIQTHNLYKDQLGDPFKVFFMLKVKDGNIYNQETLLKVRRIHDALDVIHGVDHNLLLSICSHKVKKVAVTKDSVLAEPLIEKIPTSEKEFISLRKVINENEGIVGVWVSWDEKAVLFSATFIPSLVKYSDLFQKTQDLIKAESDSNHELFAAGDPLLIGWIYKYQGEMYTIFGITVMALILLLFLYFRSAVGVLVPSLSALISAVWGLGFCGLMGFNLEPLTLVLPLLITARALSHAVQVTERYLELYDEHKNVDTAAALTIRSILPPGTLGIATDGIGIFLIAVAPLPIMQKLAYVCSFWAFSIVFTGLVLTPLLISLFPAPKNISKIVNTEQGMIQAMLGWIAKVGYGKSGVGLVIGMALLFVITGLISLKVDIGDVNPGSPILWQDSDYNEAIAEINQHFIGMEELYVIVEGARDRSVLSIEFVKKLSEFQRHMENNPLTSGTLSIADLLPTVEKYIFGGYPKWEVLPTNEDESNQAFIVLTGTSGPKDYARYFSGNLRMANVIVWTKDHMGNTIRSVISSINEFIEANKEGIANANMKFRLASGNLGVLAAANETVKDSQLLNFVLVMLTVFGLCALTYRSFLAAIILMIPLNLANFVTLSIMYFMGIGLNINTLPIVSVGIGVGIDYGIYLLSRLCEEYQGTGSEYSLATVTRAIKTTGKAIYFTATTMIVGVVIWYFLSSLRFQAEMGLLLAIIMFINMVGALLGIPALIYVIKPRFLGTVKLIVR